MKPKTFQKISLICMVAFASACGVKGDPLPPDTPAEIGRKKSDLDADTPVDRPLTSPGEKNKKKKKDDSSGK